MKKVSRTLIIGLGGTGQTTIREFKKKLFEKYGEIPELVKILAFDTDAEAYQDKPFAYTFDGIRQETKKYNLQPDEFFQLSRPSMDLIRKDPVFANLNIKELNKVYQTLDGYGSSNSRVFGRASFLYNTGAIMKRLVTAIEDLRRVETEQEQIAQGYSVVGNSITVYVVASMAGGTGSSGILDISRMLQQAGINATPVSPDVPVDGLRGMFFLPRPFMNPNNPNAEINAYVALSELDYAKSLENTSKYPIGSPELDYDINNYGLFRCNKGVRYSDVFLIDECTRKGYSFSFDELVNCVASSMITSIETPMIVPSLHDSYFVHVMGDVDGKEQYYCGLGWGEIRFDRKRFVNHFLNEQLRSLLDQYYFDDKASLDSLVEGFIISNSLNEGWKDVVSGTDDRTSWDELTDSIFTLYDPEFSSIKMEMPTVGVKASEEIEQFAQNYLSEIEEVVKLRIGQFQKLKQQQLLDNMVAFLECHQKSKGFGRFPELAKRMVRSIARMKEGLADEVTYCLGRKHEMEESLKGLSESIMSNSSKGFLGIGSQEENQKRFIELYRMKVEGCGTEREPTMARLILEMARKKKAIEVYEQLEAVVKLYYDEKPIEADNGETILEVHGKSVEIRRKFDKLKLLLEHDIDAYRPSYEAVHQTVFIDAYLKPYYEARISSLMDLPDDIIDRFGDSVSSVFEQDNEVDVAMLAGLRDELLSFLSNDSLIRKIQQREISIDDLFVSCYGKTSDIDDSHDLMRNPQLKLFKQFERFLEAHWAWNEFGGDTTYPVKSNCVVKTCDASSSIFSKENGYSICLPNTNVYHYYSTGDPDTIDFMIYETAIPAFKLRDAELWSNQYKTWKDTFYAFTDTRLEGIKMLLDF